MSAREKITRQEVASNPGGIFDEALLASLGRDLIARLSKDADLRRFLAKVVLTPSGCWEWRASKREDGYGFFWFSGKVRLAHRHSYEAFIAPIPEALAVCHHCDNPPCVNPDHLFLGHIAVNNRDMARKGRAKSPITSKQDHFKSGHAPHGESSAKARLREAEVREILANLAAGGSITKLSFQYGVAPSTIFSIKARKTWRHLSVDEGTNR